MSGLKRTFVQSSIPNAKVMNTHLLCEGKCHCTVDILFY